MRIIFRIGHGYDVHKLVKNKDLVLGGITVPYEKGLLGHSDADVLIHAIIDSLLGAAALGDIGLHFPDTDKTYENISSLLLLEQTMRLIQKERYTISNIDCTIIAQRPKLRPYIEQMRRTIAQTLQLDELNINIKATTEEGLGFTGAGDGIAAHAVSIIYR